MQRDKYFHQIQIDRSATNSVSLTDTYTRCAKLDQVKDEFNFADLKRLDICFIGEEVIEFFHRRLQNFFDAGVSFVDAFTFEPSSVGFIHRLMLAIGADNVNTIHNLTLADFGNFCEIVAGGLSRFPNLCRISVRGWLIPDPASDVYNNARTIYDWLHTPLTIGDPNLMPMHGRPKAFQCGGCPSREAYERFKAALSEWFLSARTPVNYIIVFTAPPYVQADDFNHHNDWTHEKLTLEFGVERNEVDLEIRWFCFIRSPIFSDDALGYEEKVKLQNVTNFLLDEAKKGISGNSISFPFAPIETVV